MNNIIMLEESKSESKSELLDFIKLYDTLSCNPLKIEEEYLDKKKFVVITTIIKHNWKID
jgi:hypothetical protein